MFHLTEQELLRLCEEADADIAAGRGTPAEVVRARLRAEWAEYDRGSPASHGDPDA